MRRANCRWEFREYQDRVRTTDGQRRGKAAKNTSKVEGTARGLLLRKRERSPPDTCIEN